MENINVNIEVEEINDDDNRPLYCDHCGKEIKSFTRRLRGIMEEEWSLEGGKAAFVEELEDFEGEEQVDLCCNECGEAFGIDLYNELDSLMF